MAWWAIASAAISAFSSYSQQQRDSETNEEQAAWNRWNAMMSYSTTMNNLNSQLTLTKLNAAMTMASAESFAANTKAMAEYNASLVYDTAQYNDLLYEQELQHLWDSMELDLHLMGIERAKERGQIEAHQSVSGTVIGVDSNADVIIDQKTQEALDAFVVRHGADITAAKINNARAQNLFMAEQEIGKIMFEGSLKANSAKINAAISAAGMLTEGQIIFNSGSASAAAQLVSDLASADLTFDQNQDNIDDTFTSGMFSSIGSGVSSYFDTKGTDSSFTAGIDTDSFDSGYSYSYKWKSDYSDFSGSGSNGSYWGSAGSSLLR